MEETLACLLLLLLSSSSEKYVYVDQRMNWPQAQTHCRTHYTDLAAVCSKQDTEHIQKLASKIDGFIWMGMEKFSTGGVKWMWSGGAEVTEFFWKPGQPENRSDEYYSLIQMDGWRDCQPHYSFAFFCFRVVVVREKKTWVDALDHCRELHLDLASINSETEMLLIQSELGKTRHLRARLDRFAFLPRRLAVGGRAAAGVRGLEGGDQTRVSSTQYELCCSTGDGGSSGAR
ncbi:unnamed protein product [Pleuronectes platessa]|uniref:C-type lectin domain-containing protein n=1 Tax=Pleuronectes platessa TaxID=8262 RepID=A0A9N7Y8P6_PLEPL|nr:unnamed protein product [Pleuronectes platessa]